MIFLGDFSFVRIFLKNYRVTMTTTLELHVRKIQWFCQQGEGFCMHVFSSNLVKDPASPHTKLTPFRWTSSLKVGEVLWGFPIVVVVGWYRPG